MELFIKNRPWASLFCRAVFSRISFKKCPFVNDVRLKKRKIFCQKEERSDE